MLDILEAKVKQFVSSKSGPPLIYWRMSPIDAIDIFNIENDGCLCWQHIRKES